MKTVPLADNFLVLIILAANSNPVDFCTHLRTIENAPLKSNGKIKMVTQVPSELLDFRQNVDQTIKDTSVGNSNKNHVRAIRKTNYKAILP